MLQGQLSAAALVYENKLIKERSYSDTHYIRALHQYNPFHELNPY